MTAAEATSLPPSRIVPPSGRSSPAMRRSVVVLPQPLGPTKRQNFPLSHLEGDVLHDRTVKAHKALLVRWVNRSVVI